MEKFEIDDSKTVEVYSGFVEKAKSTLSLLIENIKGNIKNYEQRIKDTTKEVDDNEAAKGKCEQEIVKMEDKISEIKDAIENVESTYKKIADAYSSTSKGDTKDLYSKIISEAKANCDKDVEKNRSEIARLNSNIEGVKGDILSYTATIDDLNKDLDDYNLELSKYNKTLEYFEKIADKASDDLDDISSEKEVPSKKNETRASKTARKISRVKDNEEAEESSTSTSSRFISEKPSILETLKSDTYKTVKEEPKEDSKVSDDFEASLKQIYDLTGYKAPKDEEEKAPSIEISKEADASVDSAPSFDFDFGMNTDKSEDVSDKKLYTDNLESLFSSNVPDKKVEDNKVESNPFLDSNFSDWENILNSTSLQMDDEVSSSSVSDAPVDDALEQLLKPYGTSFKRLKSLVGNTISYKDGSTKPFELNTKDVTDAINAIDGNDLKSMKKVGPEITILRKVKNLKEGNL